MSGASQRSGATPEAILRDPFYPRRAVAVAARLACASPEQLARRWQARPLVHARWAVMLACRKRGLSLPRIGRLFAMHHSSVLYGLRAAENLLARGDADLAAWVAEVDAA